MGLLDGFIAWQVETDVMSGLCVEVLDHELAWGFDPWPTAWRVMWEGPHGAAVLTLKRVSRTSIGNKAVGSVAMAILQGKLSYRGTQRTIYGLVELIM